MMDEVPNAALASYLRQMSAPQLAEAVMKYPAPISSAAGLVHLSGCTAAIASKATQFFIDAALSTSNTASQLAVQAASAVAQAPTHPLDEDAHHLLMQRQLKDLKAECCRHGLLAHGSKQDLANRLLRFRERQETDPQQQLPRSGAKKIDPFNYTQKRTAPNAITATFSVLVDSRERAQQKHQTILDAFSKIGVQTSTLVLPCGDFWLQHGTTGKLLPLAIERKTLPDLLHSVVTARYNDQKRLLHRSPFIEVVYLVEGSMDRLSEEERRRVLSACLTTALVHNFTVVRTSSLDESAAFIQRLGQRLVGCGDGLATATLETCEAICRELHDALQLASLPQRMLCHVHGCSAATIRELSKSAGSIKLLFDTLIAGRRNVDFSSISKPAKKLLVFLTEFLAAEQYV